jgi:hypothetical protein
MPLAKKGAKPCNSISHQTGSAAGQQGAHLFMIDSFSFTIQSLLERKAGKVTGPMSPVLFAKEMASQMETKYNRLARVWFDDEHIFQEFEDSGLTGYDSLLLGCQYKNDLQLSL